MTRPPTPVSPRSCGLRSPGCLVNTNFSDIALISQQQNNLSVTGAIPMSNGPAIPQYDPTIVGLVNGEHLTLPENSTILTGSNWLAQNDVNANVGMNARSGG